jgi:initiation factor 1A
MGKKLGGGYQKNQANKHNAPAPTHSKLRIVEEEGEVYAVVTKILGGGMAHVECIDGKKRLCHFRGKFSGKNKRQNEISPNTWVIVGVREWEADKIATGKKKEQLNNCDLLEVYSDHQKKQLMAIPREPWHLLTAHDLSIGEATEKASQSGELTEGSSIAFQTDTTSEYETLMASLSKGAAPIGTLSKSDERAQLLIDIADI